jgi:hypothetical protein
MPYAARPRSSGAFLDVLINELGFNAHEGARRADWVFVQPHGTYANNSQKDKIQ